LIGGATYSQSAAPEHRVQLFACRSCDHSVAGDSAATI
jgi:hypothetical protein